MGKEKLFSKNAQKESRGKEEQRRAKAKLPNIELGFQELRLTKADLMYIGEKKTPKFTLTIKLADKKKDDDYRDIIMEYPFFANSKTGEIYSKDKLINMYIDLAGKELTEAPDDKDELEYVKKQFEELIGNKFTAVVKWKETLLESGTMFWKPQVSYINDPEIGPNKGYELSKCKLPITLKEKQKNLDKKVEEKKQSSEVDSYNKDNSSDDLSV